MSTFGNIDFMESQKKVIQYLRKRGLARARDFSLLGIQRSQLVRLMDQGILSRTSRGVYRLSDGTMNEYSHFADVAKRVPNGVISLLSALRFHEIGTQNPSSVWLAISRKSRKPRLDYPLLQLVWFSGRAFSEGIELHKIDGVDVLIYSPAKTIADCFKYRNKVGLDVCVEALKDSLAKRKVLLKDLWFYAKVCRVSSIIRPYVEALI